VVVGEMREERKVVTALFADLVGSTALGERLDAEEVRLLVGEAVARVVHTVEGFGGTVKDLAGDGVLALFGAPATHEDDPERAVRAGLRIVREIAGLAVEVSSSWGIKGFGVRVGVSTGPVVLGPVGAGSRVEYGAYGDTVNTAARLQGAAEPGTVLVDEATVRLVEPRFEWGPERQLELKGKSAQTTVRQAVLASDAPGRRGLSGLHGPMVGRDHELLQGQEVVDAALAGTGGVLVVSGEAGIGKTRLVAELRERFEQAEGPAGREPLWLEGRCVSYGESLPYWPFRDLLRDWLGAGADDPELRLRLSLRRRAEGLFGERAEDVHPYLAALLGVSPEPEAASRLAELSPEALQYRTFEVVETLLGRLAEDRPVTVLLDDLHWADSTSIQLAERLLDLTDRTALLLVITLRPEPDQPAWKVTQEAARRLPHRSRELLLGSLAGDAGRLLLDTLVGPGILPEDLAGQILAHADGNPFYLEELVASLVAEGALVQEGQGWRFDHEVPVEIPPTVEKVILARIDRLPAADHDVLTAAAVLGRKFGLPLLEGVTGNGTLQASLSALQRLDLLRESRRWPQPEYRFKHALIQEAAYRTLLTDRRTSLHRRAAQWLENRCAENEEEAFGLLAHHWQQADDEDKAVLYLSRAADAARREWALDEAIEHYRALLRILERRGEQQEMALVLFKLALALHVSLRFSEANVAYARGFELWSPPPEPAEAPSTTLRMATSYLPRVADPTTAGWWFDIQLCMQLFDRLVEAWPERVIVPSLASRWEISDDGLRYVFHLREGLRWSDGEPLTAHDLEWGVKRVLNPDAPGGSVSVYFVLENGQDYYLRRNRDVDRIGVHALDDHTVEFRLVAPAPYFMNVVNRPDGGPQPRHAIERDGAAWAEPDRQVVSGPFRQLGRDDHELVLVRNAAYGGTRPGNVARVEIVRSSVADAVPRFDRGDLDIVRVVYSPRVADHLPPGRPDLELGPATWTAYLGFDHRHPVVSDERIRRALAHAIDRTALAERAAPNYLVANGGIVPPALHGHTPDIALRFEPDTARALFEEANGPQALGHGIELAAQDSWSYLLEPMAAQWADVLDLEVRLRTWRAEEVPSLPKPWELAPIYLSGWLPGYPDAEYMLRLLLHTDALTNEGGISHPTLDDLIDRARLQTSERRRLELFHQADRTAVAELAALIPLVYGRSTSFVQPNVRGWWEFAKTSACYADLEIDR
jgi:ABC-type transport system substrate-binding protein/class 3 adenylate cyclase